MPTINRIRKRDGRIVAFDQKKITEAIWKAAQSVGGTDKYIAEKISNQVATVLEVFFKDENNLPSVEQIQDLVEKILIENGHAKTAKAYILYRDKHHQLRQLKSQLANLGNQKEGVSIHIDLPPNSSLRDIQELCLLAYKIGSFQITVKGKKEVKFSRHETQTTLPFSEESKPVENGARFARDRNMHFVREGNENMKPETIAKKLEEIIPPPIQNNEIMVQETSTGKKSGLVEIPMIVAL